MASAIAWADDRCPPPVSEIKKRIRFTQEPFGLRYVLILTMPCQLARDIGHFKFAIYAAKLWGLNSMLAPTALSK